jgi:hypothetical protein
MLQLITDSSATLATQTSFTLQLNGNPVLFFSSSLTGGANFNSTLPFSQMLSTTLTLDFDTPVFSVSAGGLGIDGDQQSYSGAVHIDTHAAGPGAHRGRCTESTSSKTVTARPSLPVRQKGVLS